MRTFQILVVVVVTFSVIMTGCVKLTPDKLDKLKQKTAISLENEAERDLAGAQTIGNHSFIPIGLNGYPEGTSATLILMNLNLFEKRHPELIVTSWKLEQVESRICGIWVNHLRQ
jgi:hypothetical protein